MALDLARLTLGPAMRIYAVRAAWLREGEPDFWISGVFDRHHAEVFGADGAPVSTVRVTLGVRLGAFPDGFLPGQGDRVALAFIGERAVDLTTPPPAGSVVQSFIVADVQREGEGGALLVLQEG